MVYEEILVGWPRSKYKITQVFMSIAPCSQLGPFLFVSNAPSSEHNFFIVKTGTARVA
jgi:hypothetical protein